MCYLFLAVLSDWLSVPFRSVEVLCFVSPGDSGSLPCTGSSAGIESITPGKALAEGTQSGSLCFRDCLPPFCLYLEVPQGFYYKTLTTKKQNLCLGRHFALASFQGPSDLRCCAASKGRTPYFRGGGSHSFRVQIPPETFSSPFFHDISQDLMLLF